MELSPVTPTLGTQITERRKALRLSQSAAARNAGVARSTWVAWEKGTNVPEDFNYVVIERVLEWSPGSVAAILTGREPTPRPSDTGAEPPPPGYDPERWNSYDPRDQEMLRALIGMAESRSRANKSSKTDPGTVAS